jgi:uncharacterized protein (DUF2384 family)
MSADPATLTKAVLRAAEHLGMFEALPDILGVDAQAVMRMKRGESALDPTRSEWEAATRFASLFRSLVTLLGNTEDARVWLNARHATLGATPADLLRTSAGRARVVGYVDGIQKFELKLPPRSQPH